MDEIVGWLLDVYANASGVTVWLLAEDGKRHGLTHSFPVTFYAAGPFPRLRELWSLLKGKPCFLNGKPLQMQRTQRTDLFAGMLDVLAMEAPGPAAQQRLFRQVVARFPDLDYYDADIPISLRYAAAFEVFPLARCRVLVGSNGAIQAITPLESPWELYPPSPPLRVLMMEPNVDPAHRAPTHVKLGNGRGEMRLPLHPARPLLVGIQAAIKHHDPDVLLTRWGDTWLLPHLLDAGRKTKAAFFNLNRDPERQPLRRKANSYHTYGQIVYRGQQVHLFGRWHIDQTNAMMYGEYGLAGVLEQAKVTAMPVQEIARKSPGSGITAMQMLTAMRQGILVPYQKQQVERFKSAAALLRADRGGLVYQPTIGLHEHVIEIDFTSMYPSIMAKFNISPETVGVTAAEMGMAPEIELAIDQTKEGLVPATLKPLLAKRIALKQALAGMSYLDCRYQDIKQRSTALKWLLVVCFGYLGYKNARFGRIEGHEAVTAYGREMLLRAKEAAEDLGYTVLHLYVDGIWIKAEGERATGAEKVMEEMMVRTGLPLALEGIYRWAAFLPSRMDARVPVANRYFGVFRDGSLKVRGIEARRHDTPPFIAQVQMEVLEYLAAAGRPLGECLPDVVGLLRKRLAELREGKVELSRLLVTHRVSRSLDQFKSKASPAARAMTQLAAAGKELRPGQRVRFLYTIGEPGVFAWNLPESPRIEMVDVGRYEMMFFRAAAAVLQPLIEERELREWVLGHAQQLALRVDRSPYPALQKLSSL